MSNFTDFFPAAGGGGGGIPKYQDFTSSGTFTPSQELIDAGGRLAYIIVGAGASSNSVNSGGAGGAVMHGYATLTSTTGCAVIIGAGATAGGTAAGGDSSVAFASAGGTTITAAGGSGTSWVEAGNWANYGASNYASSHPGILGYGKGGGNANYGGGNYSANASNAPIKNGNYGAGGNNTIAGVQGFVRLTWFE